MALGTGAAVAGQSFNTLCGSAGPRGCRTDRRTDRRTRTARLVENPGISYSELHFLIPDSRAVFDLIFMLSHITHH
jgi:hypothetical protein